MRSLKTRCLMPDSVEELQACGMKVRSSTDLQAEVPDLDVTYINAIAWVGDL